MRFGHERGVMRWDARVWLLNERLTHMETEITALENTQAKQADPALEQSAREKLTQLNAEREDVLRQLRALGPAPRAKMG
ncbi:MAG TPA: hypothetical protein VKQ36_02890 [Ktedonobacterales bacterium]|nr:hypothetical protein [Ktedonobacterales bacterium]